jgi:hypothetical protein
VVGLSRLDQNTSKDRSMTFGFISPKKYRHRARMLRNIKIDEVSSVDSGAGRGVRVMLTKRDAPPRATEVRKWDGVGQLGDRGFRYIDSVEKGDNQMTQLQQISKALDARAHGELSDFDLARLHQAMAVSAFPTARSVGEALQKWYGTVEPNRRSTATSTSIVTSYRSATPAATAGKP